jgi:hypothetical protein
MSRFLVNNPNPRVMEQCAALDEIDVNHMAFNVPVDHEETLHVLQSFVGSSLQLSKHKGRLCMETGKLAVPHTYLESNNNPRKLLQRHQTTLVRVLQCKRAHRITIWLSCYTPHSGIQQACSHHNVLTCPPRCWCGVHQISQLRNEDETQHLPRPTQGPAGLQRNR